LVLRKPRMDEEGYNRRVYGVLWEKLCFWVKMYNVKSFINKESYFYNL